MSQTYVVLMNTSVGDVATVSGTVDGAFVTATYSLADLTTQLASSMEAAQSFIAALMLAAIPPTPVAVDQFPKQTFVL